MPEAASRVQTPPQTAQSVPPSAENEFGSGVVSGSLRTRSTRGAALALTSQVSRAAIRIGSTAVLARLLLPADFGTVALVLAVTGFFTVFNDAGLSSATVQRKNIDQAQMSAMFWLNALVGCAMFLLTCLASPVIAWFYHDSRLIAVGCAVGSGFALSAFGMQHQALLRRRMQFGSLVAAELASAILSTLFGVALARAGFHYWALVGMQLAQYGVYTLATWIASRWMPSRPSRVAGTLPMIVFGRNVTAFNILNCLGRNLDNILIGWKWGPKVLGLYANAYQLLLLPLSQIINPLSSVAVPALSRLQSEPDRFRRYYLHSLTMGIYITSTLMVTLFVFADEFVLLLLGPQWHDAGRLFRVLALSGIWQPVLSTTGWLYTSLDRSALMVRWGLISSLVESLSFLCGMHWGPVGIAAAYGVAETLLMYPGLRLATTGTPVTAGMILRTTTTPLVATALVGAAVYYCKTFLNGSGQLWTILVSLATAIAATLLLCLISRTLRKDLGELFGGLRSLLPA